MINHPLGGFFGNTVVSLSCWFRSPGEPDRFNNVTAFVVSIADVWMLATAGHVLQVLDEQKQHGLHVDWYLDDTMGSDAVSGIPIPFNLADRRNFTMRQDGFDFALIEILDHDRRLLEKNRIKPVDEAAWTVGMPDEFDGYTLVGFPHEDVQATSTVVKKAMLIADLVQIPQTEVPQELIQTAPRLFFTINQEHSEAPQTWLGVSGGPIFGYKRKEEGRLGYWLVGIQSAVARDYPIAIACLTRPFLHVVRNQLLNPVNPQA